MAAGDDGTRVKGVVRWSVLLDTREPRTTGAADALSASLARSWRLHRVLTLNGLDPVRPAA